MTEMDERFRALADFMEWVDPEGYADALTTPAPCPACDGAGVVDTSPPAAEDAPWLHTDTDCPACGGSGTTEEKP